MIEIDQAISVSPIEEDEVDKEPTLRREALVSHLIERVRAAKQYHAKAFKQMKVDMDAVSKGYSGNNWDDERYVANILQRHVHQRTSALYARIPSLLQLDASVWITKSGMKQKIV